VESEDFYFILVRFASRPTERLYLASYLATGGNDSIVNLFDTTEWLCARTITACEYVGFLSAYCAQYLPSDTCFHSHVVNAISFSHDGEFIAIANAGNYIDIVCRSSPIPSMSWAQLIYSVRRRQAYHSTVSLHLVLRRQFNGIQRSMSSHTVDRRKQGRAVRRRPRGLACLVQEHHSSKH
jgi:hypothetical protein